MMLRLFVLGLMKHIHKWNNSSFYISYYINKYDSFLIGVTIVSGFYTSVELARSKMFYFDRFCLSLKEVDYMDVQNWRFFNTVLLELSEENFLRIACILRS